MKKTMWLFFLITMLFAIIGCQETMESTKKKEIGFDEMKPSFSASSKPITLTLFEYQSFPNSDLEILINDPLKKNYPHINVVKISGIDLENVVASKEQFDLITVWHGRIPSISANLDIFENLTPLIEKHNFDLARFDQDALDTIRTVSEEESLFGLPYHVNFNALYYNKDLFDKFGTAYPDDGMTWDEAIELATNLTRVDDGTQYQGLHPDGFTRMTFPYSLVIVDPETGRSDMNSEYYRQVFEVSKRIYDIPGNAFDAGWPARFLNERTTAMVATAAGPIVGGLLANAEEFSWDIAQYPSYPDRPDVYGMYDLHVINVSKASQHKDEAFKVLEVFFSDEVQMVSARSTGRVSPLQAQKFKDNYGADMPLLDGKNIESIFKSQPSEGKRFSKEYQDVRNIAETEFQNMLDGAKDINTALRDAEMQVNQFIDAHGNF